MVDTDEKIQLLFRLYKSCKTCLWYDICDTGKICDFYSPVVDDVCDEELGVLIEKNRNDHRAAWIEYLSKKN